MSVTTLTITHGSESTQDVKNLLNRSEAHSMAIALDDYVLAVASGMRKATIDLQVDGGDSVAASGTLTFNTVGAAADTFSINGVVFTAVASGATGSQYNVGASAAATAANALAAVQATVSLQPYVTASVVGAVMTVACVSKGVLGNAITISAGQASITASGARLSGGTSPTPNTFRYGQ